MVAGLPGVIAILNIVFFIVLLSSLLQGPTIKWATQALRIAEHDERGADREATSGSR